MAILRTHKRAGQFKVIDKTCIQDNRLSFAARGLHTLLLTKPDNWKIQIKHLVKQCPEEFGEKHIYKLLKELRDAGYIQMQRLGLGGVVYNIYENPDLAEQGAGATSPKRESGSRESLPTSPKPTYPKPTSGFEASGIKDIKERFATEKEKERFATNSLTQNARERGGSERERGSKHPKRTRKAYLNNHPGIINRDGWLYLSQDGRYDELIDDWLLENQPGTDPPPVRDTSQCPDCHGSGMYYPQEFEKGAAKCRHPKLEEKSAA